VLKVASGNTVEYVETSLILACGYGSGPGLTVITEEATVPAQYV
jgi:hypothetical protein